MSRRIAVFALAIMLTGTQLTPMLCEAMCQPVAGSGAAGHHCCHCTLHSSDAALGSMPRACTHPVAEPMVEHRTQPATGVAAAVVAAAIWFRPAPDALTLPFTHHSVAISRHPPSTAQLRI